MIKLNAYKATESLLYIRCAKCSSFYFKNGNLRKYPKFHFHLHGNSRDVVWHKYGSTNRSSKCPHIKGTYDIVVNENTIIGNGPSHLNM